MGGVADSIGSAFGMGDNYDAPQADPLFIDAGGITTGISGGRAFADPSQERQQLISDIAGQYEQLGQQYQNEFAPRFESLYDRAIGDTEQLIGQVEPGVGGLTESRLEQIEDSRQRAVGNLRENMNRRRLLGSSFASDALTRRNMEFARQKEQAQAESFLKEMDLTNRLQQQRLAQEEAAANKAVENFVQGIQADVQGTQVELGEMDQLANFAQSTAKTVNNMRRFNTQLQAQAQRQAAKQAASTWGDLIGMGMGYATSDSRLKENIEHVGSSGDIPVYHFNYIGDDRRYEGVMAEDVKPIMPEAVGEYNGYLTVNYGLLDVELREVTNG